MNRNESLLARRAAVVAPGVPLVTNLTVVSGKDSVLTDENGREVIDFAGGIGVMSLGHGNPKVVDAIKRQADQLLHTCFHIATYEPYVALCERLVDLFPHGVSTGDDKGERTKALLLNSGAEAVENSIKIARQATGRPAVICFSEGFHGRTMMGMSLTSKAGYKAGCGPFVPEIYQLPFPNYYQRGDGLDVEEFVDREIERIHEAFYTLVAAEDVAAIIVEPVQGEGGFVQAPARWLRALRTICDEKGIVLIFDEVQSGFCRTGRWASYQHYDVTPDLSTWAKAMGGGLPISAVVGRASIMDATAPGTLGGTYGGNPVACASALAAIDVMEELDLNSRATKIGDTIRARMKRMQSACPQIGDVRGLGAMMAMEFVEEGDPHRPAAGLVRSVLAAALDRGLLAISAGTHGNVIRVLCPLVITDDELDRGLTILEEEVLNVCERVATPEKTESYQ